MSSCMWVSPKHFELNITKRSLTLCAPMVLCRWLILAFITLGGLKKHYHCFIEDRDYFLFNVEFLPPGKLLAYCQHPPNMSEQVLVLWHTAELDTEHLHSAWSVFFFPWLLTMSGLYFGYWVALFSMFWLLLGGFLGSPSWFPWVSLLVAMLHSLWDFHLQLNGHIFYLPLKWNRASEKLYCNHTHICGL